MKKEKNLYAVFVKGDLLIYDSFTPESAVEQFLQDMDWDDPDGDYCVMDMDSVAVYKATKSSYKITPKKTSK